MFFWRSAAPIRVAVWLDSTSAGRDRFVELSTGYSEKNSLDPLSGTTRKRDYRTEVSLLEVEDPGRKRPVLSKTVAWFEFPGWILEDSVYSRVHSAQPGVWFIGGENDSFAGSERGLFAADAAGRIRSVVLLADDRGAATVVLKRAIPSPSGRLLVLLQEGIKDTKEIRNIQNTGDARDTGADAARTRSYFAQLRIVAVATSAALPTEPGVIETTELTRTRLSEGFLSGPRWAEDNSGVYFQTTGGVYYMKATPAKPGEQPVRLAARYPACLSPGTTSGGTTSDNGRRLYFDDAAGQFLVIQENPKPDSYRATPWVEPGADRQSGDLDCQPW